VLLELILQLSANRNISGIFRWNKPADNKNMEPGEEKRKGYISRVDLFKNGYFISALESSTPP
jgi:hypothetical protein